MRNPSVSTATCPNSVALPAGSLSHLIVVLYDHISDLRPRICFVELHETWSSVRVLSPATSSTRSQSIGHSRMCNAERALVNNDSHPG